MVGSFSFNCVARNGGHGRYRACSADDVAFRRARRPKVAKLAGSRRLAFVVESKLKAKWSPEQISNWLVHEYRDDKEMRVSHETIYLSLFVQARGALRRELIKELRSSRVTRRPRGTPPSRGYRKGQGCIREKVDDFSAPSRGQ